MTGPKPADVRKLAVDRSTLDAAHAKRAVVDADRTAAALRLAAAEQEVATLRAAGASVSKITAATKRATTARRRAETLTARIMTLDRDIARVKGRIDGLNLTKLDPAWGLTSALPVALLPIRLETRFVGGQLRIRVFPDVLHVDQLEPELTAEEIALGAAYWAERWTATGAAVTEIWNRYATTTNSRRLAWIVRRSTPTNVAALGAGAPDMPSLTPRSGPTRAAVATLLPAKWTAIGVRDGVEVFRVHSRAVADPLQLTPSPTGATAPATSPGDPVQTELPLDDATRWLVDYDRALAAGMAITVAAADVQGGNLAVGFDRVVVVGVDHRSDAAATAARVAALLDVHSVTDGIGFVGHGTPTNAGADDTVALRPAAADPTVPAPAAAPAAAAGRVAAALGLSPTAVAAYAGAAIDHDPIAEAMLTALWEPTIGYFLQQLMEPLLSEAQIADLRDHLRRHVRARGPLPLLRVGDQPLGLLPVVALDHFAGNPTEAFVAEIVRALRMLWGDSIDAAAQLGSSGDPAADLVRLLQRTERSVAYRVRDVLGPAIIANTVGAEELARFQQAVAQLVLAINGITGRPRIVDLTLTDDQTVAPIPLVTGDALSETSPLAPDYIARLRSRLSSRAGYLALRDDPAVAESTLEALLIHAGELETARASIRLMIDHLDLKIGENVALADPEFVPDRYDASPDRRPVEVAVVDEGTPTQRLNVNAARAADQMLTAVSRKLSLGAYLAEADPQTLSKQARTRQYEEYRSALDAMAGRPTAELHRSAADALDVVSHRFDAWATSLATRRLAEQRAAGAVGLQVGAYGWVDDLRPRTQPVTAGYVHAPSVVQATTAAILRSGHLARSDAAAEPLAIDLRSRRVRDATRLLEGMRAGQSLAALLGYRFERALRDRSMTLAQFILPTRLAHPLPGSSDRDGGGLPTEAIAARNVVDGIALAGLDAAGREALLDRIGATGAHRSAIAAELDSLVSSLDAVGDLLVSEGVFQAVVGNADRAAAALDALDRLGPLPEVGVTRTPRSGRGIGHRLMVLLDDTAPPAGWRRLTDLRGAAEPRVNAWVGAVLGDPANVRFAADVLAEDGAVTTPVAADLSELRLSPLSTVLAATQGGEQRSELEERLLGVLARKANVSAARLRVRAAPPAGAPPGAAGFADLVAIARAITDLLGAARAVTLADLAHPNERVDPTPDVAELAARADAVVAEVREVAALLDPHAASTRAAVTRGLERAAALGIRGAVPPSDGDLDALRSQLGAAVAAAKLIVDRLDAVERGPEASSAAPHAVATHHTARLRAVLGEQMPVVPLIAVPRAVQDPLGRSLADPKLPGARRAAVSEWVLRHTRVRPPVERLWRVLSTAEARRTGVDAAQFVAAQLPVNAGDPWVGLPEAFTGGPPRADMSFVVHRTDPASGRIGSRIAALMIDQWYEHIPAASEATGVAFQFDAPGARAPQSVLLAVHPDPTLSTWSTDLLLDTVRETADLARLRTLDLDDVTAAGRFLPATYLPFNLHREVPSFDVAALMRNAARRIARRDG